MNRKWNTPEARRALLCELVGWDSRTFTEGERTFAWKLEAKLQELAYFRQHPGQLELHDSGHGRYALTALYRQPEITETVVLISHFDTVQTEEYGTLEEYACSPEELTRKLHEVKNDLPLEAQLDLDLGEYLFGRGTMDMKAGLAAHLSILEQAVDEQWPVNLLLLTVPDEEVNSAGMRAAVSALAAIREREGLTYKLFLNGEPTFTQEPGDQQEYLYTGTIGKIMPAALFYGKESHVGEPLKGITANYIASYLTQRMEFSPLFEETVYGESTPLPVSLHQKDLKTQYSTQTPYRAAALYNVFLMKQTASDVMARFEQVAFEAADACNADYGRLCMERGIAGVGSVRVMRYEQLLGYASVKLGPAAVERLKREAIARAGADERDQSFAVADALLIECQELAPAMVLLFAPPYYPAVSSSDSPLVAEAAALMKSAAIGLGTTVEQVHFYNGISDLSYVNYKDDGTGWLAYEQNTPVWGQSYDIPFAGMASLDAPVFNLGPFGKDPHQRTERLHIDSAFRRLPAMLEILIKHLARQPAEGGQTTSAVPQ
ncbi:M20/M25/M40 family metallo-hydrolase [Indiicoccus explosivorum]|uniref:M20/M25/M40 family metallo-hydrolase n=1 Tax=Indiicoccus explosivorum TaxID=1917864 RepID=UPI000B44E508|nr:M20/M25/M40 family metallo-hydrolase [Indiicoccus explosivorum]